MLGNLLIKCSRVSIKQSQYFINEENNNFAFYKDDVYHKTPMQKKRGKAEFAGRGEPAMEGVGLIPRAFLVRFFANEKMNKLYGKITIAKIESGSIQY